MIKKVLGVSVLSLFLGFQISWARCEQNYVPPTNVEELTQIKQWAIVLAFIPMADKAGYFFDSESYMQDFPNPNQAAFNFGFVTATQCYSVDVITSYYSYSVVLQRLYLKDKIHFKNFFDAAAEKYGYTPYLISIDRESEALALNEF